jgi:hypothetical protein
MALDGMQPTFRHVPPSEPRFSMQAVCFKPKHSVEHEKRMKIETHSQTHLSSLDGSYVASRAYSIQHVSQELRN